MRIFFKRLFGTLLLLAAVVGLLFSLLGVYLTWRLRPSLVTWLSSSTEAAITMLDTTSQGLQITRQALKTSIESVQAVELILSDARTTLETTMPVVDTVQTLMADELPATLRAAQTSLETAQEAARIIDAVLRTMTILNPEAYQPAKPLHEALGEIAASMQPLPQKFEDISQELKETQSQFESVQSDMAAIEANIADIETNLNEFDAVARDYKQVINRLSWNLKRGQGRIPRLVTLMDIGLSIFFLWMCMAQIGLYYQGMELLKGDREIPIEGAAQEEHNPPEGASPPEETD